MTVTALQVSCALATPVLFVLVSAGHSSTRSDGQVIVGLVVSRTVIFWTQLIELLHWSEAVQVRRITLVPLQPLLTESLKRTVTWLHVSWAAATPVALVLVSAGHSSTRSGGHVRVGLVVSRTVMVWTQLALLPQASVAVQVRAIVSVLPQLLLIESL